MSENIELEESEKLELANSCVDIMSKCKLSESSNLDQFKIEIYHTINQLQTVDKSSITEIFENNMKDIYEKTWGWDWPSKKNELFSHTSKFIICRQLDSNEIIGFSIFKFEWDDLDEPEYAVLFCYELQIQDQYRKMGIGRKMMDLLIKIEKSFQLKKTMLTCFKINTNAMEFYKKVFILIFIASYLLLQ